MYNPHSKYSKKKKKINTRTNKKQAVRNKH